MGAEIIPFAPSNERVFLPSFGMVARIQNLVANSYGIHPEHMKSPARWRKVAWPRQVAMYLARELTPHSFPTLGHFFGDRDHTTVLFAIHQVEKRMETDPLYRADVEALREALR